MPAESDPVFGLPNPLQPRGGGNGYMEPMFTLQEVGAYSGGRPSPAAEGGPVPWPDLVADVFDELLRRDHPVLHRPRGEPIVQQGQRAGHAILVASGMVKMVRFHPGGVPGRLEVLGRGDSLGALEMSHGRPHGMRAVAAGGDGVAYFLLGVSALRSLLDHVPALRDLLLRSAARRLSARDRVRTSGCGVDQRLASLLVELVAEHGRRCGSGHLLDIDLSQADLALAAGISEASAERALREWRRADVLTTGVRRLDIHDLARLRRVAEE